MREILFRGQTRRYGEKVKMNGEKVPSNWVYGGVCQGKGDFSIIYGSMDMELEQPTEKRVVYTDTVGQYTGLTDKNGTKIFEGDIIRYTRTNMYAPSCSFHKQDLVSIHLVLWDSSVSAFVQQHYSLKEKRIVGKGSAVLYDDRAKENIVEVIGNIHDNPELLESEVDSE
jgi:uncharacterized phage protein (TIGR01671 family)